VVVLESVDDVRWFARRAPELSDTVRAIVAPYIPSGTVPMLAGLGILALQADLDGISKLRAEASLSLPSPSAWNGERSISAGTAAGPVALTWLAIGTERDWTAAGSAKATKR
jgi:aconitate hydratase